MNKEVWKDIEGYNGKFQISNLGRVKNTETGRLMKTYRNNNGYQRTSFNYKGKIKHYYIHRLIAKAFIPNPENKPHINHINTIRDDNRVWVNEDGSINYEKTNLEWVTRKENSNNPLTRKHLSEAIKNKAKISKAVLVISDTKEIIGYYKSASILAKEKNVGRSCISKICLGKRSKKGYQQYMYVDDYLADWFDKEILS